MNLIDLILGIPLAWALYKGFRKGLILELATLIGLIAGLYAGLHFSHFASDLLRDRFHIQGSWLPILSFGLVFVMVLLGVYILGKLLEKTAEALMLGIFNKIGGAFFALLKMALTLSFLLFLLNNLSPSGSIFTEGQREKSYLYTSVSSFAPFLLPRIKKLPEEVQKLREA